MEINIFVSETTIENYLKAKMSEIYSLKLLITKKSKLTAMTLFYPTILYLVLTDTIMVLTIFTDTFIIHLSGI